MRVLFSCRSAYGHFNPLVPLARAAAAVGHEVAFATGDPVRASIEAAGFAAFSAGLSVDRFRAELAAGGNWIRPVPPGRTPVFLFRARLHRL